MLPFSQRFVRISMEYYTKFYYDNEKFIDACTHGDVDIITEYLSKYRSDIHGNIKPNIEKAIIHGHVDAVRVLLSFFHTDLSNRCKPDDIVENICLCINTNYQHDKSIQLLTFFYKEYTSYFTTYNHKISSSLLYNICAYGNPEIFKYILQIYPETHVTSVLFLITVYYGNEQMAYYLLDTYKYIDPIVDSKTFVSMISSFTFSCYDHYIESDIDTFNPLFKAHEVSLSFVKRSWNGIQISRNIASHIIIQKCFSIAYRNITQILN